jgi:hypothetical protein
MWWVSRLECRLLLVCLLPLSGWVLGAARPAAAVVEAVAPLRWLAAAVLVVVAAPLLVGRLVVPAVPPAAGLCSRLRWSTRCLPRPRLHSG